MDEMQIIKYMKEKQYIENEYICWDFVIEIFKDFYNIELPEYPVDEIQAEFKNKLVSNFNHIKVLPTEAKEGDIVVFSLFANQHAGVMIDNKNFIHLSHDGVKVTNLSDLLGNKIIYRIIKENE